MRRPTPKRRQPIPGLAEHLALFSGRQARKTAYSAFVAATATKIYALSIPKVRQRL